MVSKALVALCSLGCAWLGKGAVCSGKAVSAAFPNSWNTGTRGVGWRGGFCIIVQWLHAHLSVFLNLFIFFKVSFLQGFIPSFKVRLPDCLFFFCADHVSLVVTTAGLASGSTLFPSGTKTRGCLVTGIFSKDSHPQQTRAEPSPVWQSHGTHGLHSLAALDTAWCLSNQVTSPHLQARGLGRVAQQWRSLKKAFQLSHRLAAVPWMSLSLKRLIGGCV